MPFFTSSRKEEPGLPIVEEPKQSEETVKSKGSKDEDRIDATKLTSPTKPTPARTPSTRFKDPTVPTLHPERNPSNSKRPDASAASKSTSTGKTAAAKQGIDERAERPGLKRRRTTAQTRYIDMLLELDDVPKLHNILASAFVWILLAGYIVFPATFNELQTDKNLDEKANNALKAHALATARNVPLLYIAAFACGIGVFGSLWLWWKHHKNYVWVINRVFLPALMNSIAGLISTLINVYSAQEGQFSVTARATIVVTSVCSVVTILIFLIYNSIMLKWVKVRHSRETKKFAKAQAVQEREEGIVRAEGAGAV
ncbi:hypothetical protein P280DRAFT_468810 [Massarina eburnea CBS 473.64]|uniref:Uncharacterized protein n=1 Tax=Massarina eburnea CBS 473.64 TaxID=1395130 RepID=A0A6A6S4P3_9PLEO|nr:hypothetical protein P280DRAFT_468810 [Massarina eburnea CBS 473.64]